MSDNINNKCVKCRFKSDRFGNCTNVASEWQDTQIELVPTHDCKHFYSNVDSENLQNSDKDTNELKMM